MSQEPLGTLLLRRGLITDEQLAAALAEQQATGEPLGHILVAHGYTTPATVALGLATQHGGVLKTEYGFATGFDTGAVAVADVVEVRRDIDAEADRIAVQAELSLAAAETEKLRDDNARLAELRSDLEQRLGTASQRAASLERELAAAKEQHSSRSELELQLAEETRRLAELAAELAARDAAIEDFKAVADSWQTGLAERDAVIAGLVTARDDALSQLYDTNDALATRDAAVNELTVERNDALEQVRAAGGKDAQISELERERDAALETLRSCEAGVAALITARDEALARPQAVEGVAARVSELVRERDDALEKLRASEGELAEVVAARDEATALSRIMDTDPWAAADRHLLFFQGPDGYELVERDGPPPAPGAQVRFESGVRVVARVAVSPTPGPRVPCAYLVAA